MAAEPSKASNTEFLLKVFHVLGLVKHRVVLKQSHVHSIQHMGWFGSIACMKCYSMFPKSFHD